MENDNVYPNDGTYFLPREPRSQVISRKKEKAQTLEGINELKAVVDRLQQRIDYFEKNSNISDEVRLSPDKFLIEHNTHSSIARILRSEKEYIESLLNSHIN